MQIHGLDYLFAAVLRSMGHKTPELGKLPLDSSLIFSLLDVKSIYLSATIIGTEDSISPSLSATILCLAKHLSHTHLQ
jgi:hypothetical protein